MPKYFLLTVLVILNINAGELGLTFQEISHDQALAEVAANDRFPHLIHTIKTQHPYPETEINYNPEAAVYSISTPEEIFSTEVLTHRYNYFSADILRAICLRMAKKIIDIV